MNQFEDLKCPLLLDFMEDPINLPCCGKAVSRQPFIELCWNINKLCPCCQNLTSIDAYTKQPNNFDPNIIPTAKNLAYLIEEAKKTKFKFEQVQKIHKWNAKIDILMSNSVHRSIIGKLSITNSDTKFKFKTLLIPVVDQSGSMCGSPFEQVKYSLKSIVDLTYHYPQIITNIIGYSTFATVKEINTALPKELYNTDIDNMIADGGTIFSRAFEKILEICSKYKDDTTITSISIIFLTDGDDSSVAKDKRMDLVNQLKEQMKLNGNYTIHSIGFGQNHDYDFLNNLRQIGTNEGAYRYAEYTENNDSLSNKINSLLNVIVQNQTIPMKLHEHPFTILNENQGSYWMNLTGFNLGIDYEFSIIVNNEKINLVAKFDEDQDKKDIWSQWYSHLIDEIAGEIILLSTKVDSLDKQIHCELLEQRSRSIMIRVTDHNSDRLNQLMENLRIIKNGGQVDKFKLNDMKFEGKYVTNKSISNGAPIKMLNRVVPMQSIHLVRTNHESWDILMRPRVRRIKAGKTSHPIWATLGNLNNISASEWIINNTNLCDELDSNGSNALMVATSIGRCKLVKELLNYKEDMINKINKFGLNALDISILFGYWHMYDILRKYNMKPNQDGMKLFRTCITKKYYNLATRLLQDKFASVTDDLISAVPTTDGFNWLSIRSNKEIDISTAIRKGIYEMVVEKIQSINKILWSDYIDIFDKLTKDHIKIIEYLLESGKADAIEEIHVTNDEKDEITWLLFIASEKGYYDLVKILIKFIPDNKFINKQNYKGTTALWMSACNDHSDILMELLNAGANVNLPRLNGDGPLIPACQKGLKQIVEILQLAGADINIFNKERDNAILICCRNGQSEILNKLFALLKEDDTDYFMNKYAEIDGFPPLLASTELDKTDCIRVCLKYGANIEYKTKNDNSVIANGTALHLAALYGRFNSFKLLIDSGSDITSLTQDGSTVLHIAIKQNHSNIVRYILSTEKGKECLSIEDNLGRLPVYYANILGNESIKAEFFQNNMAVLLSQIIYSNKETESKCTETLLKYGRSLGCYEYNEITSTVLDNGTPLLTYALLNDNKDLLTGLVNMKANFYKDDDYKIPPLFWTTLLGYKINGIDNNASVVLMMERIENSIKGNLQNKLLLNITNKIPIIDKKLLENNDINSIVKMNNGSNITVSKGNECTYYLQGTK